MSNSEWYNQKICDIENRLDLLEKAERPEEKKKLWEKMYLHLSNPCIAKEQANTAIDEFLALLTKHLPMWHMKDFDGNFRDFIDLNELKQRIEKLR